MSKNIEKCSLQRDRSDVYKCLVLCGQSKNQKYSVNDIKQRRTTNAHIGDAQFCLKNDRND